MKTIFITITRGLIVRNILRSGILEELLKSNLRIVLLIPDVNKKNLPEYFYNEFAKDNIEIEVVPNRVLGKLEKIFNRLIVAKILFSKSTRLYLRFHIKEEKRTSNLLYWLHWIIFYPLSKITILKKVIRKIDFVLFSKSKYEKCFDKYKPDLVFSTSIVTHFDVDILKEAKKRGIKTVSMPRSWDNLDKFLFRIEPDLFLVQNEVMAKETVKYQVFSPQKIKVVGFPQFDIYANKDIIMSREEYCRAKFFDSNLPILFLGSEGAWSKGDEKIFKVIADAIKNNLISKCNILIRPHFSEVKNHNYYEVFKNYDNIYIDDKFRKSDFFHDNWDPSDEDIVDFANSLFHCNIMIAFASTLALDAACFNKPIIAIKYGVRFIDGKDRTCVMYETGHYSWVLKTKAVSLVNNDEELIQKINFYLKNPEYKQKERKELARRLCYKVDGLSSKRISDNILKVLK